MAGRGEGVEGRGSDLVTREVGGMQDRWGVAEKRSWGESVWTWVRVPNLGLVSASLLSLVGAWWPLVTLNAVSSSEGDESVIGPELQAHTDACDGGISVQDSRVPFVHFGVWGKGAVSSLSQAWP